MNVRVARLITHALGGVCGFLLLIALLQYAGVGRGYRWAADDPANAPTLPGAATDEKPLKFPPASAFAEVQAHPLFNEDRQPTPVGPDDGSDETTAPQSPLNIALTGIVSTSTVKIAMVQDKARNQSLALKVGMPLEGDQAGWTLIEVKPRSVVFRSAANEKTEVELETAVAAPPKAPTSRNSRTSPNQRGTTTNANTGNAAGSADNKRDSGDLAKRIEDRRRQMREDAEKQRNQNGKGQTPPKPPAPPKQ
jgi:general secretion pathway protein N